MLNNAKHPVPNAHRMVGAEEISRSFAAMKPLIPRLKTVITIEEAEALVTIFRLAHEAAYVRAQALTAVTGVLRDYIGRDGVLSPPRREIAQRLALPPEAVDAALGALIADGYLVELRPKGFVRRQRRFRLRMPDTNNGR